jgi:NADPH:quinone reductase-like Zn-dependent oxidoreductase
MRNRLISRYKLLVAPSKSLNISNSKHLVFTTFPLIKAKQQKYLKVSTVYQANMSSTSGQHLAAISPAKGVPLEVTHRPTPTPGPNELLIEVKAIALNPIDHYQRDFGMPPITHYPAVLGSDIGGIVVSAGSSVSPDAPKPGTRVTALAPCFAMQGLPDYGAFQKFALVPAVNAAPIPDSLSFKEASVLPLAALTTWSGWSTVGLPRDTAFTAADKKGLLVWGGASSVGSVVIQGAKLLGFTVYTTASEKHHEYLKSLGASRTFDYKSEDVVDSIVKAGKEDGLTFEYGYHAAGPQIKESMEVLAALKGDAVVGKLASAVFAREGFPKVDGVEVKFVVAPKERDEHVKFVFWVWLKEKLEKREVVPSPKIKIYEGGLEGLNKGLDDLSAGKASGQKFVVEV